MEPSARKPEDDPRYQRVRTTLNRAIVELAAEKPAERITVSELSALAGISRTTFYKHGESPAQFLSDYLINQIRPSFEPLATIFTDVGPDYLLQWRAIYVGLLEHIQVNAEVYRHVFCGDGQSIVLTRMSAYFEEVSRAYVTEFVAHIDDQQVSELWVAMAISQQVHNIIAVISSWLRTDMHQSPEAVVHTYLSLAPPWQLAKFSADGRTSLKRTRAIQQLFAQGTSELAPRRETHVSPGGNVNLPVS